MVGSGTNKLVQCTTEPDMRPPTMITRISPEVYFHVQRKAVRTIALANLTVACKKKQEDTATRKLNSCREEKKRINGMSSVGGALICASKRRTFAHRHCSTRVPH